MQVKLETAISRLPIVGYLHAATHRGQIAAAKFFSTPLMNGRDNKDPIECKANRQQVDWH
jgi:hypothetical protein